MAAHNIDQYKKIAVAVDILIFTVSDNKVEILLEKRANGPFEDALALPGVFVNIDEELDDAVKRCLLQEIGITDNMYTEQLYTWGGINRDPRSRVLSVSYIALINKSAYTPKAGERVREVCWREVSDDALEAMRKEIAYDHADMIAYALQRLRGKLEYTSIVFHMMEDEFTLPDLQKVYETILGKALYKANFRKKITEFVEETGNMRNDGHRPSRLYRWNGK